MSLLALEAKNTRALTRRRGWLADQMRKRVRSLCIFSFFLLLLRVACSPFFSLTWIFLAFLSSLSVSTGGGKSPIQTRPRFSHRQAVFSEREERNSLSSQSGGAYRERSEREREKEKQDEHRIHNVCCGALCTNPCLSAYLSVSLSLSLLP